MSLRVIAGRARGMKLRSVPGASTRPVLNRVKEALFSIIGADIRGATFLDLFAGTGSVGIEALSRGANFALFVEIDRVAIKVIHANLAHTRLAASARVQRRDSFDLLSKGPDRHYDFIYIAPPQYKNLWQRALEELDKNPRWQRHNSRVIVQIDPKEYDEERRFAQLEPIDVRSYGRTMLIFYQFGENCAELDGS